MAERSSDKAHSFFIIVLFTLISLLSLLLVIFGSSIYHAVEQSRTADNVERAGTAYLASRIAASDSVDALSRAQGPEGDMLVISEQVNGQILETRLYLYQGQLLEDYALSGTAINPHGATPIVSTEVFSFSYDDGLLSVRTSSGTQCAALRSRQGGEGL